MAALQRLQKLLDIVRAESLSTSGRGGHCERLAAPEKPVSIQAAVKRDHRASQLWGEPKEGDWNVGARSADRRFVLFGLWQRLLFMFGGKSLALGGNHIPDL